MLTNQDKKKYYYIISKSGYLKIEKAKRTYFNSPVRVNCNLKKIDKFIKFKLKNKSIINMINTNRHHTSKEIFNILVENDVNIVLNKYYDRYINLVQI